MRNEIGSSSNNPERHREDQSGDSSRSFDFVKFISNLWNRQKAQAEGCSNERRKLKEFNKEIEGKEFKDILPDVRRSIAKKALPNALVRNIREVERYEGDRSRSVAIDLIGEKADKSLVLEVVEQLSDCSRDFKLEILSAMSQWKDQSVLPKLVEKLAAASVRVDVRVDGYEMYGAIVGVIGKLGGLSEIKRVINNTYDNRINQGIMNNTVNIVKEMLESPLGGQALAEKLHHNNIFGYQRNIITGVIGILGDMSVARTLVEVPLQRVSPEMLRVIGAIGQRLDNSMEVKELSDRLVEKISQNGSNGRLQKENCKVIGKLGKRLAQLKAITEAEELSRKGVAMLFDERIADNAVPSLLHAVFEIEQHFAEPDPAERLFTQKKVNEKVSYKIAEKVINYKNRIISSYEVEKFNKRLIQVFNNKRLHNDIYKEILYAIADRIGKLENKPWMPKVFKELSAASLSEEGAAAILEVSETSNAKDVGEFFEEVNKKISDKKIERWMRKSINNFIVKMSGKLEGKDGIKKLFQKLFDRFRHEQRDNVREDIIYDIKCIGQKLDNQGDINNLCQCLVKEICNENFHNISDTLYYEHNKMIFAIEKIGQKLEDQNDINKLCQDLLNIIRKDPKYRYLMISAIVKIGKKLKDQGYINNFCHDLLEEAYNLKYFDGRKNMMHLIGEMSKQLDSQGDIKKLFQGLVNRLYKQWYTGRYCDVIPVIEEVGKKLEDQPYIKKLFKDLVKEFYNVKKSNNREYAIYIIGAIGDKLEDQPYIKKLCQDLINRLPHEKSKDICEGMIYAIGKLGDKLEDQDDIKKLCQALVKELDNEQVSVREKIISAIGEMGKKLEDQDDIKKLCQALVKELDNELHKDEYQCTRKKVIYVIGEIGERLDNQDDIKRLCQALVNRLTHEEKKEMRESVVCAIRKLGKKLEDQDDINKLCKGLMEKFPHEQYWLVRKEMISVIGEIGKQLESQGYAKELCQDMMKRLPREQDETVRKEMISVIGEIGKQLESQEDIKQLCQDMMKGHSREWENNVRKKMISAIGEIGKKLEDQPYIKKLCQDLMNRHSREWENNVRKKMISAIGEIGKKLESQDDIKKLCQDLMNRLSDEGDEHVRKEMISAIGEIAKKLESQDDIKKLCQKLVNILFNRLEDKIYSIGDICEEDDAKEFCREMLTLFPSQQSRDERRKMIALLGDLVKKLHDKDKIFMKLVDRVRYGGKLDIRKDLISVAVGMSEQLNSKNDIKELCRYLIKNDINDQDLYLHKKVISMFVEMLPKREIDKETRGWMMLAINKFGDESTALKLAGMLRLSREMYEDAQGEFKEEIYEDAQGEFKEEIYEKAEDSSAILRGGDPLVRAQIFDKNQQIQKVEHVYSENNIYDTSSDIKENEYEEIEDNVRQKMGRLAIRLLVRDAENRSQEPQPSKPVAHLKTGAVDSSQR